MNSDAAIPINVADYSRAGSNFGIAISKSEADSFLSIDMAIRAKIVAKKCKQQKF